MTRNVLWLGDSSDRNPRVPEEQRIPTIVTKRLAEETGRAFTSEVRVPWPAEDLLQLVDEWLERFEPAVVVLHLNSFWFTYESLPLKVRRLLGPLGRPVASAGLKAAGVPLLAENPVFKTARKAVVRMVGGDLTLPPRESVALISSMIRAVVALEDVVVLVRGPLNASNATGTERGLETSLRRRAYVHRAIRDLCQKLHVAYIGWDDPPPGLQAPDGMMGDEVHMSAGYQAIEAALESEALIAAWREAHGSG